MNSMMPTNHVMGLARAISTKRLMGIAPKILVSFTMGVRQVNSLANQRRGKPNC
jgi:hypothetical protein